MKALYILFASSCLVFLLACGGKDNSKFSVEGEEPMYNTDMGDKDMNDAIAHAISTLTSFDSAFAANNKNFTRFALKLKYTEGENSEYLWIGNLIKKDSSYYGTINNEVLYIHSVKEGDNVKVNDLDITDWVYYNKDKAVGGYTTRVIRAAMPEDERKKFDEESGNAYVD